MNELSELVERCSNALERCLLSKDPIKQIEQLPQGHEKKFLTFLLRPHSEQFVKDLKNKFKISGSLAQTIIDWKLKKKINSATSVEEIKSLIDSYVKKNKSSFHYSKPVQFKNTKNKQEKQVPRYPSVLSEQVSLHETVLKTIKNNSESQFISLSDAALKTLTVNELKELKLDWKQHLLQRGRIFTNKDPQFYLEFIRDVYQQKKENHKGYEIESNVFSNLDRDQFLGLFKLIPDLVNNEKYLQRWFSVNFSERLEAFTGQLTISEKDQKRALLLEIIQAIKALDAPKLRLSLQKIVREVIVLDLDRQDVSRDLFLNYIENYSNPSSSSSYWSKQFKITKQKAKGQKKQQNQRQIYLEIQTRSIDEEELIQRYLEQILKSSSSNAELFDLQRYFDTDRLLKIRAKVRLAIDGNVDEAEKTLSSEEIKNIKEKKEIYILQKTKKKFKVEEEVQLKLRIKNIKNIQVKVYQLNLEKHYLQSSSEIDETQNLSYLQPNNSYNYEVKVQNPYIVSHQEITVEGLGNKRGAWIVQLEGQGIISRAFIRKGVIGNHQTLTSVGHEFSFFDQVGGRIRELQIWMSGKKHQVTDKFVIPYGTNRTNVKLIAVKDSYAQQIDATIYPEDYYLHVGYIYSHESFLVGNKAKIILHPKLSLSCNSEQTVSLKLLENVSITVSLKNAQGNDTNLSFQNVKFKSKEDYLLEFPIQGYVSRVNIMISATVKKYNGDQAKLNHSHSIDIDLGENQSNFVDLYLKNQNSSYYVQVLGANGEQMSGVELNIQYRLYDHSQGRNQTLLTDESGRVKLGALKNIEGNLTATANLRAGAITKFWEFNNIQSQINLPRQTTYEWGHPINLPGPGDEEILLYKISPQTSQKVQNLTKTILIENGRLVLKDLSVGSYQLYYQKYRQTVYFNIVKGSPWQGKNLIYSEKTSTLYELPDRVTNSLAFGQPESQPSGEEHIKIRVPISSDPSTSQQLEKQLKAHLIATNYYPPNLHNFFSPHQFRSQNQTLTNQLWTRQSNYYNNKTMSEEASYVINRAKERDTLIGNNLQKPRILLKRIEVRETVEEDQILQNEGQFAQQAMMRQDYRIKNSAVPHARMMRSVGGSGGKRHGSLSRQVLNNPNTISSLNNFLELPATIINHQISGFSLQFTVPKAYSHYQVVLFTDKTCLVKHFDVSSCSTKKKSLAHTGIVEQNQETGWTMSRQIYSVQKGETIKVGRDSTWSAVGLEQIVNFAKLKRITLQDWVLNWKDYNQSKKLKIYDDKVCHELNAYIKENDQEFFNRIVKPFITNKLVKTFVDYCLLEDSKALEWANISKFQKLNEFEKVLLVKELVRHGRKEDALAIATAMDSITKSVRKTFEEFKVQFDTVLTAKAIQDMQRASRSEQKSLQKQFKKKKMMKEMKEESRQPMMKMMEKAECEEECLEQACFEDQADDDFFDEEDQAIQMRGRFTQNFKQMEKTKQYTETTYSGIKIPSQSSTLVRQSAFWSEAALHYAKNNPNADFISDKFMYLDSKVAFTLASCFIPNHRSTDYQMKTQAETFVIEAKSPFNIFVKQIKGLPYEKKFGVLINQRFYNPDDRYSYEEDGTAIEKEISQFVPKKPYCIQTLITNTSGTPLELQVLIDLPQGSIPLRSHEYTQIINTKVNPYVTTSLDRTFYFPETGKYNLYPANTSRKDIVIGKAQKHEALNVVEFQSPTKVESLEEILKAGSKQDVLTFLRTKNIFDSRHFDPESFYWMLSDEKFFSEAIKIFRERKYYKPEIWIFGYYHKDLQTIQQYQMSQSASNDFLFDEKAHICQYFPYYSRRAHRFLNQNKSTIRNRQFRQRYFAFIFSFLYENPTDSPNRVALAYYLVLQDRIDEADKLLGLLTEEERSSHSIQIDYIQCYIDMCKGSPSFNKARQISAKYAQYPITTWRSIFQEVILTLKQYDAEPICLENTKKIQYNTKVINEGGELRISMAPNAELEVLFFDINLQLYFSSSPFEDFKSFASNMHPNRKIVFSAGEGREERLTRPKDLKDCFIQINEKRADAKDKKIQSFLWANPDVKALLKQEKGTAQLFLNGKKQAGSYCKVYQLQNGQSKFYRDGYTDITGTFKYALADLQGISKFSILFVTDNGAVIHQVSPPSQQGYIA